MRLYANRVFAGASFTTFGLGAALFGAMILVPLYYQEVRGESVIITGLLAGPQGIGMLIAMPIAGRLTERFGGGRVAFVGRLGPVPRARSRSPSSAPTPRSLAISLVLLVRGVGIGLSLHAGDDAPPSPRCAPTSSPTRPRRSTCCSASAARSARRCWPWCCSAPAGQRHSPTQLAGAFDTAYWWALGIAALSLIPCLVLLRAENPRARRDRPPSAPSAEVESRRARGALRSRVRWPSRELQPPPRSRRARAAWRPSCSSSAWPFAASFAASAPARARHAPRRSSEPRPVRTVDRAATSAASCPPASWRAAAA